MSNVLFVSPVFKGWTANGTPLSGGKLYTYKVGTSTKAATYQNQACSVANTNPVILNPRGEAIVYLSSSRKMVLKTSDDVTVWTADNISGTTGNGVLDWDASGDGVTDDTTALQAAFDSTAATGAPLVFPPGTYKVAGKLTLTTVKDIEITGNNAVIDGSTSIDANLIQINGTLGTGYAMGSNPVAGASSFTCAGLAAAVVAGDNILLQSTDKWITGSAYYYAGEFATVASTSGATVNLTQALYDGYTGANTTVYKVTLPRVRVSGLTVKRNGAYTGLVVGLAKDLQLDNLTFTGGTSQGLYVNWVYGGTVSNVRSNNCYNSTPGADSYGAVIGSSQDLTVTSCQLLDGHHGLSLGGGGTYSGLPSGAIPNRNINLTNNIIDSNVASTRPALNSHANCEYLNVIGNRILNGAGLSSINTIMHGNIIDGKITGSAGVQFSPYKNSAFYIITDNRIKCSVTDGYGVTYLPGLASTITDKFYLSGNVIFGTKTAINLYAYASGVSTINTLSLIGNDLKSNTFKALNIDINGVYLTIGQLVIEGGSMVSTTEEAMYVYLDGTGTIRILGGYFESNRATVDGGRGIKVYYATEVDIQGATLKSNGAFDIYDNLTRAKFRNNTWVNYTASGGLAVSATTNIWAWNNDHSQSVGVPSLIVVPISAISGDGRRTVYHTEAPTWGTWAIGDRCINLNPSVGQPKSWVCTVAGTQGTWNSEGNL